MLDNRSLAKVGGSSKSAFLFVWVALLGLLTQQAAVAQVDLGTAKNFGILSGSTITFGGGFKSTTVNGDIGVYPGTAVTGLENLVLNGVNETPNRALMNTAKIDLGSAYDSAQALTATTTYTPIKDLGGLTLTPGVYKDPSSFAVTGVLTLDALGDPNAKFVFQSGSTFIMAVGSSVALLNGASANNIFYAVGSSATLNTSSILQGTILALTSISVSDGVKVTGGLLARNGAVTLVGNDLINAASAPAAPAPPLITCLAFAGVLLLQAFRRTKLTA